jgi:hypothetical protein
MPLNLLFWGMEAAYIIHCLDEATLGGGFVEMVKRNFWPEYRGKMFFAFNTVLHIINITGIILYEFFGGVMVLYPLILSWFFVTNGLWHVVEAIKFREYSPGLLTSPLYWIVIYLVTRYHVVTGGIDLFHFVISAIAGTMLSTVLIGMLFLARKNIFRPRIPRFFKG